MTFSRRWLLTALAFFMLAAGVPDPALASGGGDAGTTTPAKALAIDPDHLGRLNKLCFLPCSEYRDLKKAVESYEKSGGRVKPTAAK